MAEKQRIVFLDWLRVVACFMVMMVHASECVYSDDYSFSFPSELARRSVMFIQSFVRPVAVPLFLMASAYLLVPVKTDTKSFFRKRFTRVGIPFVVFLFSILILVLYLQAFPKRKKPNVVMLVLVGLFAWRQFKLDEPSTIVCSGGTPMNSPARRRAEGMPSKQP